MAEIILFGTGSSAQVLHYHLTQAGHSIAAFTVDQAYLQSETFLGCPVLAFESIEKHFPPHKYQMMIAIGYAQVNQVRARRCHLAKDKGYQLFSFISPSAKTWQGFMPGQHCKIGDQTLIQPFAEIGENVFIGSACIIGHHSLIGNHVFIGSGVILGGNVQVGDYAFLGSGAVARNKVLIAEHTVVGAGAVILENTAKNGIYLAATAQKMALSSQELSPG